MTSASVRIATVGVFATAALGTVAACQQATTPAPAVTVTRTVTAAPSGTGTAKSFGDGVYLVGKDIPAGTYRSLGHDRSSSVEECVWQRLKEPGDVNSIASDEVARGPALATVHRGEYFKSVGCLPWTKVG